MSQTLFLKSNLLHIRLKEGEFEVSNPETAGIMQNGKFFLWHTDSNGGYKHTESEGVDCEWPYGVELIELPDGGRDMSGPPYPIVDFKTVARLLPEEEKSESAYKEGEEEQFEKLASDIYDKWVLNYEGRLYMTKDLFTLSLYEFWNTHVVPLQEKLKIAEHLKELDDDAIVTLQKDNERLKNDLLDALDLKEGKGSTALSMAIYEIKHLREEIERLKAEQKAPSEHVLSGTMTPTPEDKRMFK